MAVDRTIGRLATWLADPTLEQAELVACRFHDHAGAWSTSHPPDEHLLVLVERGALRIRLGRQRLRAEGGGLLWIPPGPARCLEAIDNPVRVRHGNLRLRCSTPCPRRRPWQAAEAWDLQPLWEQLAEALLARDPLAELRRRALLRCLLVGAASLPQGGEARRGLDRRQRRALLATVAAAPPGSLAPADLARSLGLSADYFARRFQVSYGTTPRRWLLEQRLRRAGDLLIESQQRSVAAIATECGFSSATWFCRAFRDLQGCTPLAWRRRSRGG